MNRTRFFPNGDVDDCASGADSIDGLIETSLYTGGVEDDVDALVFAEGEAGGDDVVGCGVEDVVGAEV